MYEFFLPGPEKGGNSDLLCDEFLRGASESGNRAEKLFLKDYTIHFVQDVAPVLKEDCPVRKRMIWPKSLKNDSGRCDCYGNAGLFLYHVCPDEGFD